MSGSRDKNIRPAAGETGARSGRSASGRTQQRSAQQSRGDGSARARQASYDIEENAAGEREKALRYFESSVSPRGVPKGGARASSGAGRAQEQRPQPRRPQNSAAPAHGMRTVAEADRAQTRKPRRGVQTDGASFDNERTRQQRASSRGEPQESRATHGKNRQSRPQPERMDPGETRGPQAAVRRPQPARREDVRRRAPGDADHAPLYNQDDGTPAQPPQEETARARRLRKKAEQRHRRLTQAEMARRRVRRHIFTGLLIAAAAAGGVLLSVVLLFKITTFEVQNIDGSSPADTGVYAQDDIIAALGLSKGENLFSFRSADKKALLDAKFPLLENIRVLRRLPGTVIVRVEPAKETYCVRTDAGWATLSAGLKVIAVGEEQPALPVLRGLSTAAPQVGSALSITGEGQGELLGTLLSALDAAQLLPHVTALTLGDPEQISFLYDDRVRVELGTSNSLAYKLKLAAYILFNAKGDGLSDTDTGTLVVSDLLDDGTIEPRFSQGDPHAKDADDDAAAAAVLQQQAAAAAAAASSGTAQTAATAVPAAAPTAAPDPTAAPAASPDPAAPNATAAPAA